MNEVIEMSAGKGFSDWKVVAKQSAQYELLNTLKWFDGDSASRTANEHRRIAEQMTLLGPPAQPYVSPTLRELVDNPTHYLQIPEDEYLFISVRPQLHLAHTTNIDDALQFLHDCVIASHDNASPNDEVYIGYCRPTVMSGHILVKREQTPNSYYAEFTVGNFNLFHRGVTTPEVLVSRTSYRNNWEFRGDLVADATSWVHGQESFLCDDGSRLNRRQIAEAAWNAIKCIPSDGAFMMPGYYEVLIERFNDVATRPVFVEALPAHS